jgi:uncharacterized membrane protein
MYFVVSFTAQITSTGVMIFKFFLPKFFAKIGVFDSNES